MRKWHVALAVILAGGCGAVGPSEPDRLCVETGLDVLVRTGFERLAGKHVAVITNLTGRTKDGRHLVDVLHEAKRVELVAIFGPEHGLRGVEPDGTRVASGRDEALGVPVISLYGKTRKPTPEMLANVDVLVFDIQDVGARFYTYISTMALAMEAAARDGKTFVVLDRPNPITGVAVEGPMLEDGFQSFVGMFRLPVRHGLTVGELARLLKGEGWIEGAGHLDLVVVKMTGWSRRAWYDETDLPWIGPSPSMKTLATATVYPGLCLLEGTNVSAGRGTDRPFETIGAPWIERERLAAALNRLGLIGVTFQPITFTPVASPSVPRPKFKDETCGGVTLRVDRRDAFSPVETGVRIIDTLRKLYPDRFAWRRRIDRLYGSDRLRKALEKGADLSAIIAGHGEGVEEFMAIRSRYLLYE
jgi:uncharacterized protein YbbC (DUF1343 family)